MLLIWSGFQQPIQRLCLGKTEQQCASIDYCIRTTNRDVSMCRNLGIPLSRLPSYPAGMLPRRQFSVVLTRLTPDHFTILQDFFHRAPKASLERLSLSARVKARVRLTRNADDDGLEVLKILVVRAVLRGLSGNPDRQTPEVSKPRDLGHPAKPSRFSKTARPRGYLAWRYVYGATPQASSSKTARPGAPGLDRRQNHHHSALLWLPGSSYMSSCETQQYLRNYRIPRQIESRQIASKRVLNLLCWK